MSYGMKVGYNEKDLGNDSTRYVENIPLSLGALVFSKIKTVARLTQILSDLMWAQPRSDIWKVR